MLSVSTKIWTHQVVSISYDDSYTTTSALSSACIHVCVCVCVCYEEDKIQVEKSHQIDRCYNDRADLKPKIFKYFTLKICYFSP